MVEQWNSVPQCGTVWWNSVEQHGETVEQKSVVDSVERHGGTVAQYSGTL